MSRLFSSRGRPLAPSKFNAKTEPGLYTIMVVSLTYHWEGWQQRRVRQGEMNINYTCRTFFQAVKECRRLNLANPNNLHYPMPYRKDL